MSFDLSAYLNAAVQGVPLAFVVMGLVWAWGELGVKGPWQMVSSLATGLVLGGGYMVAQTRPPVGDAWQAFGYWFAVAVYGLGLGVMSSGLYEFGKDTILKAVHLERRANGE